MNTTRKRFRQLIADPGLLVLPGAYDALSARLIESQGFDAMVAGGYAAVGSMLGQADMGQSNMRDFADHYARIAQSVEIPVYADADTGFGGVHNVRQAVHAFEAAGVAGLFLNDQTFPNRCGYLPGKSVIGVDEMLAKIKAAVDARTDPELFICARTDVFAVGGLDAAIERCCRFMEAGADMAKPQGVDKAVDIARVIQQVPGPHFGTMSQAAGKPATRLEELQALGVAAVTFPSLALFAAAMGVNRVMAALRSGGSLVDAQRDLMPLDDYYRLVGLEDMTRREVLYAGL